MHKNESNPPAQENAVRKSALEIIMRDARTHKAPLIFAAAILFAVSLIVFSSQIKSMLVIALFIIFGAISRIWQRFFPISFGVELVMLFTVASGILYGPVSGMAVGLISLVLSTVITQEDISKMWPAFLAISAVGFIAGSAEIQNVSAWGVGLTVLYDAIISLIYIFTGHSIMKTLIFDATHIAFNYFVFYNIAPALLSIIS